MRLLLFSDLHCDTNVARDLVQRAKGIDIAIGAGDFANVRRNLSVCLKILRKLPCPVILVAGNNESTEELEAECAGWSQVHVLHGTGTNLLGQDFFGLGGGVPITPFGSWSYDFSEEEAGKLLRGCPPGAVLISHSPPKGAVDVSSSGQSLGSTAVRDTILRCKPRLVVCGHIHASAGQSKKIGESDVINAGPYGIVYDLKP